MLLNEPQDIPSSGALEKFEELPQAVSLTAGLDNLYLKSRRPLVDEAVLAAAARGDALRCLRYPEWGGDGRPS